MVTVCSIIIIIETFRWKRKEKENEKIMVRGRKEGK